MTADSRRPRLHLILTVVTLATAIVGIIGMPFQFGMQYQSIKSRVEAQESATAELRACIQKNEQDHTEIKLSLHNLSNAMSAKFGVRF